MKNFNLILTERTTRMFNVEAETLEDAMQQSANIASALTEAQNKNEAYPQSIMGRFYDVQAQEYGKETFRDSSKLSLHFLLEVTTATPVSSRSETNSG